MRFVSLVLLMMLFLFASCSLNYMKSAASEDSVPEFVFNDAAFLRVEGGKKKAVIKASKLEQYKTDSVSFAENASFKTYDDSGKEKALGKCVLISADIDNGIFVMLGNIELDLPSDNIKIIAESLKMNKKTEQIVSRSGSSVLLQKDGVEISGKGFCASGASKSYAFMQNVSGSIDTEDR